MEELVENTVVPTAEEVALRKLVISLFNLDKKKCKAVIQLFGSGMFGAIMNVRIELKPRSLFAQKDYVTAKGSNVLLWIHQNGKRANLASLRKLLEVNLPMDEWDKLKHIDDKRGWRVEDHVRLAAEVVWLLVREVPHSVEKDDNVEPLTVMAAAVGQISDLLRVHKLVAA